MREQGGHVTLASPVNLARSTAAVLPRLIQDSARGVLVLGAPALFSWAGDDLWSRRWALTSPGWGNLGLSLFAWGFTAEAPSVGAVEEEGPGGPAGPGGVRVLRSGSEPLRWRVVRGGSSAFAVTTLSPWLWESFHADHVFGYLFWL